MARPQAKFKQTNIYFPGYMKDIYRQIAVRDSLRKVREHEAAIAEREAAKKAHMDSLSRLQLHADSLALADSLAKIDSLKNISLPKDRADSLKTSLDSLSVTDTSALTPEQIKAAKKAEAQRKKEAAKAAREAEKKRRQEEKEQHWADLDKRDEYKAKLKEEKKLQKLRQKKRKALEDQARQAAKDAEYLEKYHQKYLQQKRESELKKTK